MDTKTYLKQISRLDDMIENTRQDIERLKSLAMSITVPMDKEKVQTSGTSDLIASSVSAYVDLEREKVNSWAKQRELAVHQIEGLENHAYYKVLYKRYVLDRSLEDIRNNMGYSRTQINRLMNSALEDFEKKYIETYRNL